jgi:hypothetical protein
VFQSHGTAGDKLNADDSFVAAVDKGSQMTVGGADDSLAQVIYGEPDPNREIEYVTVVRAVSATGNVARGMEVGIELAQRAEKIMDTPTLFLADVTGIYGGVSWATAHENVRGLEAAQNALASDVSWAQFVDKETAGVYAEEPALADDLSASGLTSCKQVKGSPAFRPGSLFRSCWPVLRGSLATRREARLEGRDQIVDRRHRPGVRAALREEAHDGRRVVERPRVDAGVRDRAARVRGGRGGRGRLHAGARVARIAPGQPGDRYRHHHGENDGDERDESGEVPPLRGERSHVRVPSSGPAVRPDPMSDLVR